MLKPSLQLQARAAADDDAAAAAGDPPAAVADHRAAGAYPRTARIQRHARAGRGHRERRLRVALRAPRPRPRPPRRAEEPPVEVVDDGWADQSVGPAENPWSGGGSGDEDRQQEFADSSGQSLRDHLLWQLELARLDAARAGDRARRDRCHQRRRLPERAAGCRSAPASSPSSIPSVEEVERVLSIVQMFDPPGVGARSVSECLLLQLEQLEPATAGPRHRQVHRAQSSRAAGRARADGAAARAAHLG